VYKKAMVVALLLALCVVPFTSCGAAAKPAISYWSMWNKGEPQQRVIERAIADFEKEYGVKVDVKWAGRDVTNAIKPRLLAGENIDLVDQSAEELYGGVAANGISSRMNDVLEMQIPHEGKKVKDVIGRETYDAYVRKDGSLYIIPYSVVSAGFWYNKVLFRELNIEPPTTWEQFLSVAGKLRKAGLDPLAFGLQTEVYRGYIPYHTAMRILGPGSLNAAASDRTGKLFEDPRWVEVGDILYAFSKKGKNIFMEGYESSVYPAPQMDWIMDRAGMFFCGSWIPVETRPAAGPDFEYGCFPFPVFKGQNGDPTAIECSPFGFGVLKNAKNEGLAKEFVAFFLQKKYAESWVNDTMNMTPRKDVPAPKELRDIRLSLSKAKTTFRKDDGVQADYPQWYAAVYLPVLGDVLSGNINGTQFARQMRDETVKFWAHRK
jgi:raffinose/stachyose/melibiose transport system substrate-binding protein